MASPCMATIVASHVLRYAFSRNSSSAINYVLGTESVHQHDEGHDEDDKRARGKEHERGRRYVGQRRIARDRNRMIVVVMLFLMSRGLFRLGLENHGLLGFHFREDHGRFAVFRRS